VFEKEVQKNTFLSRGGQNGKHRIFHIYALLWSGNAGRMDEIINASRILVERKKQGKIIHHSKTMKMESTIFITIKYKQLYF
jgi:hypothetical protein